MKKILGLDLGTNSIGWALVDTDFENKKGKVLGMGSRVIPMTRDVKDDFGKGNSISKTSRRTQFRGIRRLRERHLLRRERLLRVLNVLGFLPDHFSSQIDFKINKGQFKKGKEPKIAYDGNEFIFKISFFEMLEDFRVAKPFLIENGKKVPYDWTLYYLRKKALKDKIKKEELAWLILNFNQKRGYYQLRGEEEIKDDSKLVEFYSLKIIDITEDETDNGKSDKWYNLHLENGWVYRRQSKVPLDDWLNKTKDFIVTTHLEKDGSLKKGKDGTVKRSFRAPKEDDWELKKKKTEQEIIKSKKKLGEYIYENLLEDPSQKIRGGLIGTIERKYYKEELIAILEKQISLQPELFGKDVYSRAITELYQNNRRHRELLSHQNFVHLFIEDIIFYQRPLRSQKSNIQNCKLEFRYYKSTGGTLVKSYLKGIPKSNPLYQEFRVWQWIYNLRIYTRESDNDLSNEFLKTRLDYERLFEFLMSKKEVNHIDVISYLVENQIRNENQLITASELKKQVKNELKLYRWNYVFDDSQEKEKDKSKSYPMNETTYQILTRLKKVVSFRDEIFNNEFEKSLWHIIYSVKDKKEYEKALSTFAIKKGLNKESFIENFKNFPPFPNDYGRFSSKAIKRLLSLMRLGKYWDWENIDVKTKERIQKILTGEVDENIRTRVREKTIDLEEEKDFQGLQLWLAQYIIYDRHSELSDTEKWNVPMDITNFINEFKQHSLRNPIVEQIVLETLRTVKDIWVEFGDGEEGFFKEIHIELGREMKNTADARKRITQSNIEKEATNQRIKLMLLELFKDEKIEDVRPYSPIQGEMLKIYEEGALNSQEEIPLEIEKISKSANPTSKELQKYKLWLNQKYCSPYTGVPIPLSKLFTSEYEIEHIIPQARYFDDSYSNKVICEAEVNRLKGKKLAMEFVQNHQGETVDIGMGKTVRILSESAYESLVKENFKNNKAKLNKLLMIEIPDKMYPPHFKLNI